MKFTAIYVEPNTDSAIANLILADPETNPDEPAVLMFSPSIEFQDSSYYFEVNDPSLDHYGGLKLVQVSRDSLEIQLEPGVVEEFGNEDLATVQVTLEIDDQNYQSMLEALKNIFANEKILVVN